MVVAIGTFEMHFPEVHSLKEKRQILRSLIDRVKAKFNASIAEVANNDLWQRGTIGVAMVANDRLLLQQMAQKIDDILGDHSQVEVIDNYWDYI
ncbi:MAG: DUF503 domain-containing protein [Erysipelotrichia bacterium]|nr:DUF503 domain-containing protein [Candidatus Riflebacteria bacterium]NCB37387.1 DUF503 domain-containing protein [Erysipelotrichia bacterium]